MFRKYVHLIDKRLFVLYNLRKEHLFEKANRQRYVFRKRKRKWER